MATTGYPIIIVSIIEYCKNQMALLPQIGDVNIYDEVPKSAEYPYVTVAEGTEVPFNTFDRKGKDITLTLNIWSRYKGWKECTLILERLNTLLDYQEIPLINSAENYLVYLRYENSNLIRDPDGVTRHLSADYRAILQDSG